MAGKITHKWDGTTLIITSDSGTSSCDLKGDQGDMGVRGPQGKPGLLTDTSGIVLAPAENYYMKQEVDDAIAALDGEVNDTVEALDKELSADIQEVENSLSMQNKRLENLEFRLSNAYFSTDNSVAYVKSVPEDVLPYAEINEIGGMTRKCTNLLDIPTQTVSGTHAYYAVMLGDFELPAGTYTLSAKHTHTGELQGSLDVRQYGSVDKYLGVSTIYPNTSGTVTNRFSVPDGVKGVRIYLYSNSTSTAGNTSVTLTDIMLNSGSTALPYEPYFEGLRSAAVEEIVSEGVNLCSPFNIGKGVDDITGAITERPKQACTDLIRIQGMTSCVWSGVESSIFSCIYFYNSAKKYMGRSVAGSRSQWVITSQLLTANLTNAGGEIFYIRLWYGENTTTSGTIDLINNTHSMLNKGSTALPYRPYVKLSTVLPEEVLALPDYGVGIPGTDYYNRIRWRYDEQTDSYVREYEKRVGVVDMGTFDWTVQTNSSGVTFFQTVATVDVADSANGINILCAPYTSVTNREQLTDKTISPRNTNAINRICVCDSIYADAATFKAAMSGVMLYYGLATPEITDISDILSEDNLIKVEAGGSITMENEYGYDVPSTVTYQYLGGAL